MDKTCHPPSTTKHPTEDSLIMASATAASNSTEDSLAMASGAPSPAASNANVRTAFQIAELDRVVFTDICNRLLTSDDGDNDDSPSQIPANIVAVLLISIVKGLAFPNAYLAPKSVLPRMGGIRRLAMNFVQFQSQSSVATTANVMTQHVSLVQVAQHCSKLMKKWGEIEGGSTILSILYEYFLQYGGGRLGEWNEIFPTVDAGNGKPAASPLISDMNSEQVRRFVNLLSNTLEGICSCTRQCLEDIMDFEYIWASVLKDKGGNAPNFGQDDASKQDDMKMDKKRKSSGDPNMTSDAEHIYLESGQSLSSTHLRGVAKGLAWSISQISHTHRQSAGNGTDQSCERKERIINAAACIDLVIASLLAPVICAPAEKRRRLESGEIDPRLSIEDEAAAALSTMLDGSIEIGLREKAKASLVRATGALLSAVTNERSTLQPKDIMVTAQKVASAMLPLIAGNSPDSSKLGSPASQLLSNISSHELREKTLRKLKDWIPKTLSSKVQVSLFNSALAESKEQKALKIGWYISNLQRCYFIDPNELCQLKLSERKFLAPLLSKPSQHQLTGNDNSGVRAIVYGNQQRKTPLSGSSPKGIVRHSVQISRVSNPPTTGEVTDLNQWVTAMSCIVSSTTVKPSPWLLDHLSSISDGKDWNNIVLPVLNYFLAIISAEDGSVDTDAHLLSGRGEYVFQLDNVAPGAVLQLYYWALEGIIRCSSNTRFTSVRFHSSLFALCHFSFVKAQNPEGSCFLIEDIGDCPIAFYRLITTFMDVLKPGSESVAENRALAVPLYIIRILDQLQELLLGMMWMTNDFGHTFTSMVNEVKDSTKWHHICPTEWSKFRPIEGSSREETLVGYVLNNLVEVTKHRVAALCELLSLRHAGAAMAKTMEIFTTMLHHRTDIFFDRHPDQLMMCSLYTAICAMSTFTLETSFQQIADAYMEMNRDQIGSEVSYAILHRIKNCSDDDHQYGDIIVLFNDVFVPSLKSFWPTLKKWRPLSSKPKKKSAFQDYVSAASSENTADASSRQERQFAGDEIDVHREEVDDTTNSTTEMEVDTEKDRTVIERRSLDKSSMDDTSYDGQNEAEKQPSLAEMQTGEEENDAVGEDEEKESVATIVERELSKLDVESASENSPVVWDCPKCDKTYYYRKPGVVSANINNHIKRHCHGIWFRPSSRSRPAY